MKILAIETSCDETSASVVEKTNKDVEILSNVVASQIDLHKKYGGVFPELASRAHSEKIIPVVAEALEKSKPDIIAVTNGPGLIGSLLIGINFAKTYAFANKLPIIGINHWLGHIYSNFVRENSKVKTQKSKLPEFPLIALIVSGGHTGLVLMKSHTDIASLGETLDDAAGEAFDKAARLLQLGYPGGPSISKAAEKGNFKTFNFPRSMLAQKNYNFSFSGLKTAVLYESKKYPEISSQKKADFAASFQQAVIDTLVGKTIQAAKEFKPKSILLCGGVSANKELREQMENAVSILSYHPSFHVPSFSLTGDNAAMIGIAAAYQNPKNFTSWDKIRADANLRL